MGLFGHYEFNTSCLQREYERKNKVDVTDKNL